MALPEKNYYYLQDISSRWSIPLQDIRYYAEHSLLEIQTWLPETIVRLYRNKRTEDGDIAAVPVGVSSYKGYAVIEPDELRKIFRNSPRPVEKFRSTANNDTLKILDTSKKFMVFAEDLVICKCERDRFEKEHDIVTRLGRHSSKNCPEPSFAGRPTLMARVLKEFERRCEQNCIEPSLLREGKVLAAWAAENIDAEQTPKQRTIMNAIRPKYRVHVEKQLQTVKNNQGNQLSKII